MNKTDWEGLKHTWLNPMYNEPREPSGCTIVMEAMRQRDALAQLATDEAMRPVFADVVQRLVGWELERGASRK